MNEFMGAVGNVMPGVTPENYYQIIDYLRDSGHDVSGVPRSRFDRERDQRMLDYTEEMGRSGDFKYDSPPYVTTRMTPEAVEGPLSRYQQGQNLGYGNKMSQENKEISLKALNELTDTFDPIGKAAAATVSGLRSLFKNKSSISQEEMSQIDDDYEAQYGESLEVAQARRGNGPIVYGPKTPVGEDLKDDIPALSLVEDNRSVADMFADIQPRGLETMIPQRSGVRSSMLSRPGLSTEMMTETGLDSMAREYQNDQMPKMTSLLESKIAPVGNIASVEKLLAELDRTRKETDEAGLPRASVDSNAMREDLARGVDIAALRESYPNTDDAMLLKYITAKEAGTTKVNERVEKRQAVEALDVVDEMSNALYEIQKGDTLYGLSRERGTSVDDIMALNPRIENADLIYAGDTLNLSGGGITPYKMNNGRTTPYSNKPPYREGVNQFGQESGIGYALSTIVNPLGAAGNAVVDALSFKENRKSAFQEMINNILAGNPISSGARKALGDYKAEFPELAKQITRSVAGDYTLPELSMGNIVAANNAPPVAEEEIMAETAAANNAGGAGGNVNSNLLGTPKEFTPQSINFSNLRSLLGESDIDYKKMGVDYKGLLANEEARSKLASEEARRDAGSNALIQLGAGIAAGDLSKGLSKAGEVAMLGKKDARAEDRNLSTLKRQIELADRTQESTLGIKSAEEGRKNREKLVGFEIEVQKDAIKTNKSVYDAYIQHQTLLTAREKLPDEEQKRLDKQLTQSSINYRNAMAKSLKDGMSDLDLDAYVKTAMAGDVNLQLTLSELSSSKKREWARTQIANGVIPGMARGSNSAESYGNAVMVAP